MSEMILKPNNGFSIIGQAFSKGLLITSIVLLPFWGIAQNSGTNNLIAKQMFQAITELRDFVAIPKDAVNPADIKKNIEWSHKAFVKRGFKTSLVVNGNLPIFVAERTFTKGSKTVMFYFHIDGQPVRANEWFQKDPFISVLKEPDNKGEFKEVAWKLLDTRVNDEWRIFGRSTSDDKGPIVMFLQALDIMQANNNSLHLTSK
jgi:acetylornithine deacetylase/succinyl-diaminopimelate desuccinylase-like protein